jgi:hypothetical protein
VPLQAQHNLKVAAVKAGEKNSRGCVVSLTVQIGFQASELNRTPMLENPTRCSGVPRAGSFPPPPETKAEV